MNNNLVLVKRVMTKAAFLWDDPDQVIQDHSDHGASKEPMNPLWTRIDAP